MLAILQSWFLLLIFKLTFKGLSQCMPTVGVLYFSPFNPFHYSVLPLYLPPRFSVAFSTHPYVLYLHILGYMILLMRYHSLFLSCFLSFIEYFHCHKRLLGLNFCMVTNLVLCICLSVDMSSTYE
jgi:hypothetical protein